jgi:hypothetical protein
MASASVDDDFRPARQILVHGMNRQYASCLLHGKKVSGAIF